MGCSMNAIPFLTLAVRTRKDALRGRHRARQIAQLLGFGTHDQGCLTAATFLIVCRALDQFGHAILSFRIEQHHLHISAAMAGENSAAASPARPAVFPTQSAPLPLQISRAIPPGQALDDTDLAWLVRRIESSGGSGLFDEIVAQNLEILALMHELAELRAKIGKGHSPRDLHAA
jgi:hypothetical protein